MDSETTIKRIAIDLANLRPVEEVMKQFRKKYDLERELVASAFPEAFRERYNLGNPTLFFRDLAQRLWAGGADAGGIEILKAFWFAGPLIDRVGIDWRRQAITYQPQTKLQAAFYYLLQNSQLAKVCGNQNCVQPYFIGKRANERYCSDACFAEAQRFSKKEWWGEHGKEWRAERSSRDIVKVRSGTSGEVVKYRRAPKKEKP